MKVRFLAGLLAIVMVVSLLPVSVRADGSDLGMRKLSGDESYTTMTTSQSMVDMIKDMEGFSATPYWDVNQWSIGYGSSCGSDKSNQPDLTVTEEEAEQMLMDTLAENYGKTVNDYCTSIGRQPSQQQFDALVDFTYNLGGSWTSGCQLTTWLENPTTEMDFVNAIGRWGRVSSKANYGTCMRRIREAIVFLRGEYYLAHGSNDFESDLSVVSNANLPYYKLVIFQSNGGTFGSTSDEIGYYLAGESYGSFKTPTREGYVFQGWEVTAENNSTLDVSYSINTQAQASKHLELTAVWATDPEATEPTEPEETEPPVTEPVETLPPETEPEETTPPETEPPVTEPEETTPPETEPPVTEPEETVPPETTPEEPSVELPFRDVAKTAWYRKYVEFVYENGYMYGTTSKLFSPEVGLSRGMLVTVLYRMDGEPEVDESDRRFFADAQGDYYTDPVGWARANGIVYGVTASRFAPDQLITRQDAVAIFYRYCVDYLGMEDHATGDLSGFRDGKKVDSYAVDAMVWAVDVGLISGSPSGGGVYLNPRGNLTRAEAATILTFLAQLMAEAV